ncbi:MAG: AMP-binding protein [bacterium]
MSFFDALDLHGDAPAVISEQDAVVTYAELARAADAVGAHLVGRPLVFVVCENSAASISGYLGCLRARAVPLLLGRSITPESLASLVSLYQPEFLWLPTEHPARATAGADVHRDGPYALVRTGATGGAPLHDELAMLLTTSGTTGSPMLVRLSRENITSNAAAIASYLGITDAERPITTLPMHYTYGLSIINSHLLRGSAILATDRAVIDRGFWQMLTRHGATSLGGVPYTYEMLKRLGFAKMELPTLRTITQAGGKLSPALAREFATVCEAKGIRFVVMYGQSEATARMSYLPSERAIDKAGSIGIAIPEGMFWLEDASGQPVTAADTEGELVYRGPNVSLGYSGSRADLAKGDENKGTLRTGDLATRDADGFYYITGRKKRFLKLFGNRVNLDDVERLLSDMGHACACAGRDDHLVIYATGDVDTIALRASISAQMSIHPSAVTVRTIAQLPRSESGKLLYSALPQ